MPALFALRDACADASAALFSAAAAAPVAATSAAPVLAVEADAIPQVRSPKPVVDASLLAPVARARCTMRDERCEMRDWSCAFRVAR